MLSWVLAFAPIYFYGKLMFSRFIVAALFIPLLECCVPTYYRKYSLPVLYIFSLILTIGLQLKSEPLFILAILIGIGCALKIIRWFEKPRKLRWEENLLVIIIPLLANIGSFKCVLDSPKAFGIGKEVGVSIIGPQGYGKLLSQTLSIRLTSRIIASDAEGKYIFVADDRFLERYNASPPFEKLGLAPIWGNEIAVDDNSGAVYFGDARSPSIYKVDLKTGNHLAKIRLKDMKARGPIRIRLDPDHRNLFVLDEEGGLYIISVADFKMKSLFLGVHHPSIAVDFSRDKIFLTNRMDRPGITVVDAQKMNIVENRSLEGFNPNEISIDPLRRRMFNTNYRDEYFAVHDLDSLRLIKKIYVGFGFRFLIYDPILNLVYLQNYSFGDMAIVDPDRCEVISKVGVGRRARCLFIRPKERTVLTSTAAGLVEVNPFAIIHRSSWKNQEKLTTFK